MSICFITFFSFSFYLFIYFVLSAIFSAEITTKFNQEMYTKMRAKKNGSLSSLGKRVVRVVEKGTPTAPATSVPETMRMASPATSVEEITLQKKKPRVADKGKEKAYS